MLDAAQLRPGEGVLDVGCGFGTSTLEAAERVAPPAGLSASTSPQQCSTPPGSASQPAGVDNVELNFVPYAGQQGVVMDATAWLVTAHR
jgi:cyclopropane fatty-acyl-phospholipid synthase-like methyltransferase